MSILVAIASWTVGSIVFGLVLGRIFGVAAKRRRAEEQFIASLQAGNCDTARAYAEGPKPP